MAASAVAAAKEADNKMVAELIAAEKKSTEVAVAAAESETDYGIESGAHKVRC